MNKLENHTLSQKLQKQSVKNPILFFADVDGTLFTAGWQIMKAPLYNFQTSQILEKNNIPNILVTGRPRWNQFSNYEMF